MEVSDLRLVREILELLEESTGHYANLTHLRILLAVIEFERQGIPVEIRSLAKHLNIDRRTVSRAISLMRQQGTEHRKGFDLLRVEAAKDRRSKRVYLSELGQRLSRDLAKRVDQLLVPEEPVGIVLTNIQGEIEWVNAAFTEFSGYELNECVGERPATLLHGADTDAETRNLLRQSHINRTPVRVQITNYTRELTPYRIDLVVEPLRSGGRLTGFIAQQRLIVDR